MRFLPESQAYYVEQFAVLGLTVGNWVGPLVGLLQFAVAAALFTPRLRASQWLLLLYAGLALIPLGMLFTHPVWIESEGGFPVIGAGQGLIKYLCIAGVSLYFAAAARPAAALRQRQVALFVILAGLLLVMVWIGGMKFTAVEARGVESLMRSSPLLGWTYSLFSVQGASNLIGCVELVGAIGLLFWRRIPLLFLGGALINLATYITTQTFLFSLPAWHPELGFPALGGSGEFIVKDLALLAGTLLLLRHSRPTGPQGPAG